MLIYLGTIALMSCVTYILYAVDKKRAKQNQWRISENALLLSSILFGALGGILAMYHFRHKTKHWYFIAINVVSLMIHIGLGVYLYLWTLA